MPNVKIGEDTLTNVSVVKLTDADDTSKFVEFCSSGRATFEITAPAGSTIDILQNSIIIKSYTLGASETFCSLKVDVSSTLYTVRATLDSKTDEQEVLANAANIYTITLKFKLWLYKDGTILPITGGLSNLVTTLGYINYVEESDGILFPVTTQQGRCGFITNNTMQNIANKTLCVEWTFIRTVTSSNMSYLRIYLANSSAYEDWKKYYNIIVGSSPAAGTYTSSFNIGNFDNYPIAVADFEGVEKINKVWIE